jgi:vancomycin permeability regulator SanA
MLFWLSFLLLVILLFTGLVPRLLTRWYSHARLFNPESAPPDRVAIVFGAGLWWDGSPSPVLRDRIATGAELYFSGKVEKLLMSGDNSTQFHNEPGAMREYALSLGVPDEDIVLDYAGRRTYDSCYRARDIFNLDSAVLVTQAFHLPRALYTCNMLGVSAVGVPADQHRYRLSSQAIWNLRETFATVVALWQIHISRPLPVLGDAEPIFPQEAQ